jgi:hypothetical protein
MSTYGIRKDERASLWGVTVDGEWFDQPNYSDATYAAGVPMWKSQERAQEVAADLTENVSARWCAMEYEGTDTDGTVWNRCTVHDQLAMDGAYICEGYVPPPYTGGH